MTTVSSGNVSMLAFLIRLGQIEQGSRNMKVKVMKEHLKEMCEDSGANYDDTYTGIDHSCVIRYKSTQGKNRKIEVVEWDRSYTEIEY